MSWIEAAKLANQAIECQQDIQKTTSLPENWNSAISPDGQNYYYNKETGETCWTHPGSKETVSIHERLSTPKSKKEKARKQKKGKLPGWSWNAKAKLHAAPDKHTKESREKAARESKLTMKNPNILQKVHGLDAHLQRRSDGDIVRRTLDVTDHILAAEVGQVTKKTPALFSEAHGFDLYGWNPSTTLGENSNRQRKTEELKSLPRVKNQEMILKKHPIDIYGGIVKRVMEEVQNIDKTSRLS